MFEAYLIFLAFIKRGGGNPVLFIIKAAWLNHTGSWFHFRPISLAAKEISRQNWRILFRKYILLSTYISYMNFNTLNMFTEYINTALSQRKVDIDMPRINEIKKTRINTFFIIFVLLTRVLIRYTSILHDQMNVLLQ